MESTCESDVTPVSPRHLNAGIPLPPAIFDTVLVHSRHGPAIFLLGELDIVTAGSFTLALAGAEDSAALHITLDCHGLSFCDTAGMRAIVMAHRRLAHSHRLLTVSGMRPTIKRLVSLMGFYDRLQFDLPAAV